MAGPIPVICPAESAGTSSQWWPMWRGLLGSRRAVGIRGKGPHGFGQWPLLASKRPLQGIGCVRVANQDFSHALAH